MTEVKVDIKRTGFPIKVGEVELWFDTSLESLVRFYDVEEEATKRLNEFEKEVLESNIGKEVEENSVTKDTVLGAIELEKKRLEIQFDLLFGEGVFKQLYTKYPDYTALENTFETLVDLVTKRLDEEMAERAEQAKNSTAKYTKKAAAKKAKNKK